MMRRGFSLLELMIAIALSSIIMLALVQANRNAARLLREAQYLLVVNRQVGLLYNQLERDITCCVPYAAPVAYRPPKPVHKTADEHGHSPAEASPPVAEKKDEQPDNKDGVPTPRGEQKKEVFIPSCVLEPFEEGAYRVGDKKWQQTKKISFITTTPLEVYEQEHERMVRVGYELVYDKKLSLPQKSVYTLYRLQTDELANVTFKEDENKKTSPISRTVVAQYIKQFSLEAAYEKRPVESKDSPMIGADDQEVVEPVKVFVWGEEEEKHKSKTMVPDQFSVHIELWDAPLNRSYSFSCVLPVFVKVEAKKEPKKDQDKKDDTQVTDQQTDKTSGEGAAGAAPVKQDGVKNAQS